MEYICNDCPRQCNSLRTDETPGGVCHSPALPVIARAAPHFGEEPCLSGKKGAGAVFFSGCSLRCIFCQNHEISRGTAVGKTVNADELADIFLRLQDQGVHNIDLVTPTHYTRVIRSALEKAKLAIPVVWNSSGYESVETLTTLDGLVQIYMPDLKYMSTDCAKKYSAAPDYPEAACAALQEMFRQRGAYRMDNDGILLSGLLIRHLILPENIYDSMSVIDYVAEHFPQGSVLFSLMSQYTPMPAAAKFPELTHRIDPETAEHLTRYMLKCGIQDGFCQELQSATEEMIPDFDMTGVSNASREN